MSNSLNSGESIELESVVIGHTEPSSFLDIERLCGECALYRNRITELETERNSLEVQNGDLQQKNLSLQRDLNVMRREKRQHEDYIDVERQNTNKTIADLRTENEEKANHINDLKYKHKLEIIRKDEQITLLSRENRDLQNRIRLHDGHTDIRQRPSKKFRKSVLQECRRCKSAVTNDNDVCYYHPEKPVRAPTYTKDNPVMLWKCCYLVSKHEPHGCTNGERHVVGDLVLPI